MRALDGLALPEGAWLVSLDVEALYNSIPHTRGVGVVEGFISLSGESSPAYNQFILDLLRFILHNNIFIFERSHYLQIQGVAMGTKCAPSYANLYLGGWEQDLLFDDNIQRFFEQIPIWRRYIDDIFFIWTGSHTDLLMFF